MYLNGSYQRLKGFIRYVIILFYVELVQNFVKNVKSIKPTCLYFLAYHGLRKFVYNFIHIYILYILKINKIKYRYFIILWFKFIELNNQIIIGYE